MNYFSRNKMPKVGICQASSLFLEMDENQNSAFPIEHTQEILNAAMGGSIAQEDFNLYGYDYICKRRSTENIRKRFSKEYSLIEELPEGESFLPGAITTAKVPTEEEGYDVAENNVVFSEATWYLLNNRLTLQRKTRRDPLILLLGAINQEPAAINAMREITAEDPELKEVFSDLILSGVNRVTTFLANILEPEGIPVYPNLP